MLRQVESKNKSLQSNFWESCLIRINSQGNLNLGLSIDLYGCMYVWYKFYFITILTTYYYFELNFKVKKFIYIIEWKLAIGFYF